MEQSEIQRAVEAGWSTASELGLWVDDAVVVNNSNRIVVRLTPCDVLARVAPTPHHRGSEFEVEVARRLAQTDSPVAELEPRVEPRVYMRGGFAVTLWAYYEPETSPVIAPAEYAHALTRLHAGLRQVDVAAPHFTDRVADAQRALTEGEETPELPDADRELLTSSLSRLSATIIGHRLGEQLLHGEPHPGNLLRTRKGLLFVDLETFCHGPVEFDIAHAPEEVGEHYPEADRDVIEQCRTLMWAMITTWRWQRHDDLPNGRYWRTEGLNRLRGAIPSGSA